MNWLQFSVQTDKAHAEQTELALENAGALSVTATDAADQPLLEPGPGETPLWDQLIITGLFPGDVARDEVLANIMQASHIEQAGQILVETLADQEWARSWMEHFKPMPFGKRLWVCPQAYEPPDPDAVNMRLDPGLAFGTGTHPTTSLCLEWLDGEELQGLDVLDYGCGSGILAIAAALLGAKKVWAVDNDEQALIATKDNAIKNDVSDRIPCYLPDDLADDIHVDLCIANILAGPIMSLAPLLAQHVRPGGTVVLSGILQEQSEEVQQCYQQWFNMKPAISKEGWVLLQGQRHDQDAT